MHVHGTQILQAVPWGSGPVGRLHKAQLAAGSQGRVFWGGKGKMSVGSVWFAAEEGQESPLPWMVHTGFAGELWERGFGVLG